MLMCYWSSDVCSSDLWKMVWKAILFGFTVAAFISVFVPPVFWDTLFIGAGCGQGLAFLAVLENAAVAPIVAFFTFIGSMGNVPLAAMLWSKGNSFGGVMAFLGADLVAATDRKSTRLNSSH